MRVRRRWMYLLLALAVNVSVLVYLAVLQHTDSAGSHQHRREINEQLTLHQDHHSARRNYNRKPDLSTSNVSNAKSDVTVLIREFEDFDNDVGKTVSSLQQTFTNLNILVIGDKSPYPPLETDDINPQGFKFISLQTQLWKNVSESRPELFIKTKYVFIMPDSTVMEDADIFNNLAKVLKESPDIKILAVPVNKAQVIFSQISVNLKTWTLDFSGTKTSDCNYVQGQHAIFMETRTFLQFSEPFIKPVALSVYIQAALRHWDVKLVDPKTISTLSQLYQEPHSRWKHKHAEELRRTSLYKQFGIKLVIRENGKREWYGCTKETERCFDTVVNDMPEFLFENRWTPPCCLNALRTTSQHVFSILESCQARFWLEGGSLLGAVRHGDIIPWDYDVDIGIYLQDVAKCDYLRQCAEGSYVDENGFVWEKAREGDFYRVQYSETNRLHVDIFPFFSRNGTMTKNTWIKSHRQDAEFPEHFLKPLTKISFAGLSVKAPNNVRQFLEYKFGAGVIENPKYPNEQDPV